MIKLVGFNLKIYGVYNMENTKIRSFGRIKSRKLSNNKIDILNNILPIYQVNNDKTYLQNLCDLNDNILFEIGFGYGEHTVHQAQLKPFSTIIACETYINGILSIISKMKEENIKNIKLYNGDARLLLENMPDHSIDKIFILFPDPWPKKKQNKRRIINEEFVELIKLKLKIGGTLFFASDILNYVEWTIEHINSRLQPLFNNIEECQKEPDWWLKTRYQQKAIKEGRSSYFLEFKNIL